MLAHYDDPSFSYSNYWQNRSYEHAAEIIAISRLLDKHHFKTATDIGGGFGRLTSVLAGYSTTATLLEPSAKLRSQAKKYLGNQKNIRIVPGTAEHTRLPSQSQELLLSVRVFHHIPDLRPVFIEARRILKPEGLFLFEFANSSHFKSRLKSLITGTPILLTPVERRSSANIRRQTIFFVNHHPHTILKLLRQNSFIPLQVLSVSNFRSPLLKKILPFKLLLILEKISQPLLAKSYFGPSIFILAKYQPSPSSPV